MAYVLLRINSLRKNKSVQSTDTRLPFSLPPGLQKFESLPTIIEAWQFKGLTKGVGPGLWHTGSPDFRCFVIPINGQRAYLEVGDWVITEPDGKHHYPCKPDIFEKRWRPIPKEVSDGN